MFLLLIPAVLTAVSVALKVNMILDSATGIYLDR